MMIKKTLAREVPRAGTHPHAAAPVPALTGPMSRERLKPAGRDNFILSTDSYKFSHAKMFAPNIHNAHYYLSNRKGGRFKEAVVFGLQHELIKLAGAVITPEAIAEARSFVRPHFREAEQSTQGGHTVRMAAPSLFEEDNWSYIARVHAGHLPLRIKALPEGTLAPEGSALLTVEATDPKCFWLPGFVEGRLQHLWFPMTVATQSREWKKIIAAGLSRTTGSLDGLTLKLHDFGFRGVECDEAAALGGAAHLVNCEGTDNLPALKLSRYSYGEWMAGYSVPAAEHSTITSWGEKMEAEAYRAILRAFPNAVVSVVSDSYDIDHAVSHVWGEVLKDEVKARQYPVVIRPDTGDPADMVLNVFTRLGAKFAEDVRVNAHGFKELPPYLAVIQGDGIDGDRIQRIIDTLVGAGWSTGSLVFGSGGGLLQKHNRDSLRVAYKLSAIERDGKWTDVQKKPKSDPSKASFAGRMKVVQGKLGLQTLRLEAPGENLLQTVFENGHIVRSTNLQEVRLRAALGDEWATPYGLGRSAA